MAALWGPWQPAQLRGGSDKRVKAQDGAGGRKEAFLLQEQDRCELCAYCIYAYICECVIKHVTVPELRSRTTWSSVRRVLSEQMSNVKLKTPPPPISFILRHLFTVYLEPGVFLPRYYRVRVRVCPLPVGSLNTALASACVWMMLFRSTAMLGTLFFASCFSAACSDEGKQTSSYYLVSQTTQQCNFRIVLQELR